MESTNNTTNCSMFAVIRHGERADHVAPKYHPENYDNDHDPPLTAVGLQQAATTGDYLQSELSKKGFDEIIIECSPFVRCIQTAS